MKSQYFWPFLVLLGVLPVASLRTLKQPGGAQGTPKEALGGSICVLDVLWGTSGATLGLMTAPGAPFLFLLWLFLVHVLAFSLLFVRSPRFK